MSVKRNHQRLEDIFFVAYLIFTSIQNLRRIPWVDEFQAYNLATKSKSYLDLILAASADLHPPLWHFLIRVFSYAWEDYNVIKFLLFITTLATIVAIKRMDFLPLYLKICLLLSSYFTFTYTSVSRDYSLVVCMTFWIIYFHKSKSLSHVKNLLIALLSFTNIFGLFLSVYFLLLNLKKSTKKPPKVYATYISIVFCQFLSALVLNPWNKDGLEISPDGFDIHRGLINFSHILFQSISPRSQLENLGAIFGLLIVITIGFLIFKFSEQPKSQLFSWLFLVLLLVLFADKGFPNGTHEWNRGMFFLALAIQLILVYPNYSQENILRRKCFTKLRVLRSQFLIGGLIIALFTPSIINTFYVYRNINFSKSSFTFYVDPLRDFVNNLDCFEVNNNVYLVSDTYGDWVTTQMNAYLPKSRKVQFFVSDNDSPWITWTQKRAEMNNLLLRNEAELLEKFMEEKHGCFVIQDLMYQRNLKLFRAYTISNSTPEIYGYLKPNKFFLLVKKSL